MVLALFLMHFIGLAVTATLLVATIYAGTPRIMKRIEGNEELKDNLGAVVHLIHGSSDGSFSITFCPGLGSGPGHLMEEIEGVGFRYAPLEDMSKKYPLETLKDRWQRGSSSEE
jgi:hypothetical protein